MFTIQPGLDKLYELYWFPHIICTYAEGIE